MTTLILFQNNDAIIQAAKEHTINVFVVDDPSAHYLLNKMGIEGDFRHSAPIFRDELPRAVRKGDAATLHTVSEGFAAIEPGKLKANRREMVWPYYQWVWALPHLRWLRSGGDDPPHCGLGRWNRTLSKGILHRTAKLQSLSRQLVELQESERRQLSRELHDRVGQNLTALTINLGILETVLTSREDAEIRARLHDSAALLESTMDARARLCEGRMRDVRAG